MEIYKDIKGYEGYYQVSNYGNIKSIERIVSAHHGERELQIKSRILKPSLSTDGYKRVSLCINKKQRTFKIHRLVAQAFISFINIGQEVNHKDGIKTNNNSSNLEIVTHKENVIHAYKTGLAKGLKGEMNPNCKLTEADVLMIRKTALGKRNYGRNELAKRFNVSVKHIQDIVNSKTLWQDGKP